MLKSVWKHIELAKVSSHAIPQGKSWFIWLLHSQYSCSDTIFRRCKEKIVLHYSVWINILSSMTKPAWNIFWSFNYTEKKRAIERIGLLKSSWHYQSYFSQHLRGDFFKESLVLESVIPCHHHHPHASYSVTTILCRHL